MFPMHFRLSLNSDRVVKVDFSAKSLELSPLPKGDGLPTGSNLVSFSGFRVCIEECDAIDHIHDHSAQE